MPEKQGIFHIEKQEAGRDIFNIAIQHVATGKRINLPSIQYALRKGETNKGAFFKNEPEWIDFEQGYIVERKEVSEIIKNLENEKVQLVLGKPASGKSVILKNLGYKLANENKKVYVIELKKHQIEDIKLYFEAIPEINDENPIFIVDDAHLYPSECEKLIRDFKSGGKGRLIIGSRPTEDILPIHPKKTSEFQFLHKTEINAEDITREMIWTFLEKQYKFGDERIETVSKNLQKYKNDLWQLSWALNSYKPEKDSVDEEEIYENIMVSITEIETTDRKAISGEDVFLPLSVFYRHEIPIERYFLEEQLGIEKNIINQLIAIQEIVETKKAGHKMLSMHHSSLSDLYFDAYLREADLGRRIKKIILNGKDENEDNLSLCSFYRYITTTDEKNAINVIIGLRKDFLNNEKGGKILLIKMIENDQILKSIEKGIEKEEDIEKIGESVWAIASQNKEVGLKLANNIDINALSSKIDAEEDIGKILWCVTGIAEGSRVVTLELVNHIDAGVLSAKIEKKRDLGYIGLYVSSIANASKKLGLELANRIDIDVISAKIDKEEDIEKIGLFVADIAFVSKEAGMKLVGSVSSKIDKEEDIEKIVGCIRNVSESSRDKEVALKLVESINVEALILKIDKEEDIEKIGECVLLIAYRSKEVALKLIESIDVGALTSKIDKEEVIEKIVSCVSEIAWASHEVANKLINRLNPKLREELQKRMSKL